jgi:hypothetical protein
MTLRKFLFFICLVISIACLAVGYLTSGLWIGSVIAIITGLIWLTARKNPTSWLPLLCLLASVCLAVVGRLIGASSLLMICGSGFSLATWDLLFLENELKHSSYDEQTRRYENKHLLSLALVLGFGLTVTFIGRLLTFKVPFVVMMFFIALFVFALERIWGKIKKRGMHNP